MEHIPFQERGNFLKSLLPSWEALASIVASLRFNEVAYQLLMFQSLLFQGKLSSFSFPALNKGRFFCPSRYSCITNKQ